MNYQAALDYLERKGWVRRSDGLWVKSGSFIDTADKKNALTTADAFNLQNVFDDWDKDKALKTEGE